MDDERTPEFKHDPTLALRAALDEVRVGVVLLDHEMRAQFINRAFRKMWRLPDHKADSKPPFVALMYHGRDMRAYEVPAAELDTYVAERVEHIRRGDPSPRDLRLSSGEVLRLQCAILPNGGRMLSYTNVTDIVRQSEELDVLRAALDKVEDGVVLLDSGFNISFINETARRLFKVPAHETVSRPPFSLLVANARKNGLFDIPADQIDAFLARRLAQLRAGDTTPEDLSTRDGRSIRVHCTALPDSGRMLTYCDVTDLIHNAERFEQLATTDTLTGMTNRTYFLELANSEWERFRRYQRPLSMLMIDVDHFKRVNDRFGHATGDEALKLVAGTCCERQRASDVAGRIGGEEFAMLLPETDIGQAIVVAERVRSALAARPLIIDGAAIQLSVSIGVAEATLSMSGIEALMKAADRALYQAKEQGRNLVVSYEDRAPPMSHAAE